MRKSLFESARTSAGNYNINTKGLGDAILTLPPLNEQRKIIDEVASLERAIAENLGKLRHLEQIKSALVSDLLTGRKRVPMDELTAAE
jgi:type I restriction enzyme S subunit